MVQSDRTIPPGGKGHITLQIETKDFNKRIRKTANVFSNDPKNPKLTIVIAGNLWVPILVSANRVILRGLVQEDITNTVMIKGQKQKPLELEVNFMSPGDKATVELHKQSEDGGFAAVFKNILKDEGFYVGELKLKTNYADHPEIRIQIMGAIQHLVAARPKMLTFGRVAANTLSSTDGFVRIHEVMVSLTQNDNLIIEKVAMEKPLFTAEQEELEPGRRYKIRVKPISERLTNGLNTDLLKIHTNIEHYEIIKVPVNIIVDE